MYYPFLFALLFLTQVANTKWGTFGNFKIEVLLTMWKPFFKIFLAWFNVINLSFRGIKPRLPKDGHMQIIYVKVLTVMNDIINIQHLLSSGDEHTMRMRSPVIYHLAYSGYVSLYFLVV